MMVNLLDDSNFHRQIPVMTRLIEMIIQNPVFGISCIISMLVHSTSQCLTSFTNIQKSTECTFYVVNEPDTRKTMFWSVAAFNQTLSSQCNLTAQVEPVHDK
jgi:hypothetical protein